MYADQRRMKNVGNDRQKRIDARKAEIEERQNPNSRKIDVCIDLINYCIRKKPTDQPQKLANQEKKEDYMTAGR